MKPIKLKLSGLQSYRETQEIDFEDLCQMGLFGIFGPTGSGKSTLLDAMTLALYGKVERAVNGTQGIMNHSEDTLFVSFCFELTSSEGPQRYRVERRFKRTNELSVSNTISRFIEIKADGEHVLADKLAEVTRCVEEKIGLKMDDFTRAVVLPQGKFAEFLSLKGSERRQMLQRLFHLEQYGDQLAIKLSRRVKENDSALKEVEAEQQGLGHAGKEALEEAGKLLKEAEHQAEASRLKLQTASGEAEKLGKIREWQNEKQRRQAQLAQLTAQESEIITLEQRLREAAAAAALLPALTLWRDSRKEWERKESEAAARAAAAEEAEKMAQKACEADDTAQSELSSEEPKLLQRQEQLEQAVVLQKERDELKRGLERIITQRNEVSHRVSELQQSLIKEQELLNKGLLRQSELQEKLQKLEVRSKDRGQLHKAVQQLQFLTSIEETQKKLGKEYREQEAKVATIQRLLEQSKQDRQQIDEHGLQFTTKLSQYVEYIQAQERLSASVLATLDEEEKRVRELMKAREQHALSLALAAELKDGQPCPVCGSTHHPYAASAGGEEAIVQEGHDEQLGQLRLRGQEIRLGLRQLLHEGRSLLDKETPEGADAFDHTAAGLEHPYNHESAPSFSAEDWTRRMNEMETTVKESSSEMRKLRQEADELQKRRENAREQAVKQAADAEAGAAVLGQLQLKLDQAKDEHKRLLANWDEELRELPPHEVQQRYAEMQKKDAEAEEIKERLQVSFPFIEEKKNSVQTIERKLVELDKAVIQWDAQLQGKQELLQEKEDRLQAWIGSSSAESLLVECKQRLQLLRAQAAAAKQLRQSAEQSKHEEAKAAAMARSAAEAAAAHYQSAAARWEQQLGASLFATDQEVEEACLHEEETERYLEKVSRHRESERGLHLQLRHIDEQLSGSSLTEEEWLNITAELEACRRADEEALSAKARAQRDLEDIEKRHGRWMELEEARRKRQLEGEKLSKLQSSLRGNAFVEYIAEEQLMQVSQSASQRLRFLTKQRYALEVDSGGGFLIRDDANGGVRRPVSTLSGGETFLTSLSLALALSAQIQLRGQYPLQFFFLDEGFGTLDPELLDTVITSLERLHNDRLSVGIISHVPELRARLPRKLIVVPAEQAGGGSRIVPEQM